MKELITYTLGEINHLAVFVAALVNFFFGALWYSPIGFAKTWSKLNFGDADMDEIKKKVNMGYTMGMAFIATWIMAYGLAVPIVVFEVLEFNLTIIIGFSLFIWGVFQLMNMYKHSLFEMKSFKLILINGLHDAITMILMTIVIVSMQKPDIDKLKDLLESMLR